MKKIAFYGSIWSGDYQVVAAILRKWIKSEDLKIKIRIIGEEIVYEDERIYLYSYTSIPTKLGESFLLEGNMSGTLYEAKVLLEQLQQLCKDGDIASDFDYLEVNEEGEQLSEEFYIK